MTLPPPLRIPHPCRRTATLAAVLASIALPAILAQSAPAPARDARPAGARPADEIIALSPFEIVADTKGYYSANTMSGTRFNTKLEDLASSLTVVTKEQMADFAMLDINDIFLYTANTEGTGTYTDFVIDRNGQPYDNVQLNPTGANRVRGIAAANVSLGNIETMGRVPVDPLAVESVEISRGPNANVFGLGNPSGTLNMVPSSANLSRDFTQATVRADSYDGYRTSLDLNRVLLKNRLALRTSGSFQHDGYTRKPSGTNTIRYNGMVKFQPFPTTTISAAASHYRMNGNRPNYMPPRDDVSYWIASGRPGWDPIAEVIHVNGTTLGPFTTATGIPDYISAAGTGLRSQVYIDQTGLAYWTVPTTSNGAAPSGGSQSVRLMSTNPAPGTTAGLFAAQPLFTTVPSLTDKSIYDWSSLNLASVNRLIDQTQTFSLQLDQLFLNTPRQKLAVQVSFMRENAKRYKRTPIGDTGNSGQSGLFQVDPNERLLDGSRNPFFGRPFIAASEPVYRENPALWDTTRAQLAYQLDLTKERSWLRHLGSHQASGYAEFKYRVSRTYRYRDAVVDDHAWIAPGTLRGSEGSTLLGAPGAATIRAYLRYYVGDANGTNADYAPHDFKYGPATYVWGTYTIVGGLPAPNSGVFHYEPVVMGQASAVDGTGGAANVKQIIRTRGAVLQSHFLADKVVTTFGVRRDQTFAKDGSTPQALTPDGMGFNYESIDHWAVGDYQTNSGPTKTGGAVVRPFRDLGIISQGVADPNAAVRFLAHTLRGLAFTYNKSDSFTPSTPAKNLFLQRLPNPSGTGKDYGLWLDLLDGRLVVRLNRYENKQLNARDGDANTIAQRVTRIDGLLAVDPWALYSRATDWVKAVNPTWSSQQVETEVIRQTGLSGALYNAYQELPTAATNDVTAKGTELEINFNLNRYWTVAIAGAETRSINTNISSAMTRWIAQRMPIWTTIRDQRDNLLWWTKSYGGSSWAANYFAVNVETPSLVILEQEGKSKPTISRYSGKFSTNLRLGALTDQPVLKRFNVGGAVRWQDRSAIGYYGKQTLPAVIRSLDVNRPIWGRPQYYFDAFVGYKTTVFRDKVGATFRLNVRNLQEGGHLEPIGAFPDGTAHSFRIVDPRQFILQATFDL